MFGGMAAAGDDPPLPRADGQHIAVADALEAGGKLADDLVETAPGFLAQFRDGRVGPAGTNAEIHRFGRRRLADIEHQRSRQQIFGAGDLQRHVPALAQPPRQSEVIGVIMGDDDARHRLAGHRPGEQRFPMGAGAREVHAGVDDRPTIPGVEDPQVDVIETEGQRHPRPVHARRHFEHRAACRYPAAEGVMQPAQVLGATRFGRAGDDARGSSGGKRHVGHGTTLG